MTVAYCHLTSDWPTTRYTLRSGEKQEQQHKYKSLPLSTTAVWFRSVRALQTTQLKLHRTKTRENHIRSNPEHYLEFWYRWIQTPSGHRVSGTGGSGPPRVTGSRVQVDPDPLGSPGLGYRWIRTPSGHRVSGTGGSGPPRVTGSRVQVDPDPLGSPGLGYRWIRTPSGHRVSGTGGSGPPRVTGSRVQVDPDPLGSPGLGYRWIRTPSGHRVSGTGGSGPPRVTGSRVQVDP
ncbi:uncharacterized protein LOC116356180 [Oncorhynchus kisutch]|uniref:uncharacterized protein LOC116356180 n=1 Tax=Oncorhynchus kisutch TaxID=8019 RepID=UPI0012DC2296|nr:uncharacterized protein LOC116356180 [Oncorhynchus kisutch]